MFRTWSSALRKFECFRSQWKNFDGNGEKSSEGVLLPDQQSKMREENGLLATWRIIEPFDLCREDGTDTDAMEGPVEQELLAVVYREEYVFVNRTWVKCG